MTEPTDKVSMQDIVSKYPSDKAKEAVENALKESVADQEVVSAKAKLIQSDPTLLDSEIDALFDKLYIQAKGYREHGIFYGGTIRQDIKALIATETAKARLDELGSVQLDYGKQQAHVWVNGKLVHIDTRLSELQEMLNHE